VDGINRPREENEMILFTPEFHRTTLTEPGGIETRRLFSRNGEKEKS
jgi:hypothetical protein